MSINNDNQKFERRLDKSKIPICNILGVNIAAINMEWLLKYLDKNIDCCMETISVFQTCIPL